MDEFTIERAPRAGRGNATGKPRTIVAKFNNYKVKESFLKSKKGLKGTNVYVREDFSQKIPAKRKELLPKMHEERRKSNVAFFRYDQLVVYPSRSGRENPPRSPQSSPFLCASRGRDNQLGKHHHNHRRSTLHTVENCEISLSFIILLNALFYTK